MLTIIVLLCLTICFIIAFNFAGQWLVTQDPLQKVDAIVAISGDQGERVKYSVKLFKNNYADHLILSGCPGTKNLSCALSMKDQAIMLGVPQESIILDVLQDHSSGTNIQARNIKKIMSKNNFKSAILVTSNFHTRRSKMLFKRAFNRSKIKLLVTYPEKTNFNPAGWWKRKHDRRIVISELIKFVWYWIVFYG